MTKKLFFIFLLIFSCVLSYSQIYIYNGSLEGIQQQDIPPIGWTGCKLNSTPDTQPGSWNVNNSPSHGSTYLGMCVRGNLGPYANTTEACQQKLDYPLQIGKKYVLTADLAKSGSWGHNSPFGWVSYTNASKLRVWGGVSNCSMTELLAESNLIDHTNWINYSFELSPTIGNYSYFILELTYGSLPTYFGNMLLDNLTIKENDTSQFTCQMMIPNLITPNHDNHNDFFEIKCLPDNCSLEVWNRWGDLIFASNNYDNNWNPENCVDGIYFYHLTTERGDQTKGWIQIIK